VRMRQAAEGVRAEPEVKGRGTVASFAMAEAVFGEARGSLLRALVASSITDGGTRLPRVTRPWRIYRAVMNNPYLGRFWRHLLGYLVCSSGLLNQQAFRGLRADFLPGEKRSASWADLSLFLYAREGDAILTMDRGVRSLAAIVDPDARLRVGPLSEIR
jgi:hypothetical protein